jgi:hypothetical protein
MYHEYSIFKARFLLTQAEESRLIRPIIVQGNSVSNLEDILNSILFHTPCYIDIHYHCNVHACIILKTPQVTQAH